MAAFARPWRSVEGLAPAIIHAWPDSFFKLDISDAEVVFSCGKVVVTLTLEDLECRCKGTGSCRSTGVADTTILAKDLLGAKVQCDGIEAGQIKSSIALLVKSDEKKSKIVLRHAYAPTPAGERSQQSQLGRPLDSSETAVYTTNRLPLSIQEYVAAQINSFLERQRGEGSVQVENDLTFTLDTHDNTSPQAGVSSHEEPTHNSRDDTDGSIPPSGACDAHDPGSVASLSPAESSTAAPCSSAAFSEAFAGSRPVSRPTECTPPLPVAGTGLAMGKVPGGHLGILYYPPSSSPWSYPQLWPTGPKADALDDHPDHVDAFFQHSIRISIMAVTGLRYLIAAWPKLRAFQDIYEGCQNAQGIASTAALRAVDGLLATKGLVPNVEGSRGEPARTAFENCVETRSKEIDYSSIFMLFAMVPGAVLILSIMVTSIVRKLRVFRMTVSDAGTMVQVLPEFLCRGDGLMKEWTWLSRQLLAVSQLCIREEIVEAKATAAALPLDRPCMILELHTATCIHRVTHEFWPRRGFGWFTCDPMQPQAIESIAAAINRHIAQRSAPAPAHSAPHASAPSAHTHGGTCDGPRAAPSAYIPLRATGPKAGSAATCSTACAEPGGEASGAADLGRPVQELKCVQADAVRATNLQQPDGRWVSTAIPPRASAHIRLLRRSPGELHMQLPWPSSGHTSTTVLLVLGTVVANFSLFLHLAGWNAIGVLRGAWPGQLWYFALRIACTCFGTLLCALGMTAELPERLDVHIGRDGYRIAKLPWWTPPDPETEAANARDLALLFGAHGPVESLAGAEVRVADEPGSGKVNSGQSTTVMLHLWDAATGTEEVSGLVQKREAVPIVPADVGGNLALQSFTVMDKLFVAGQINACIAELQADAPQPQG